MHFNALRPLDTLKLWGFYLMPLNVMKMVPGRDQWHFVACPILQELSFLSCKKWIWIWYCCYYIDFTQVWGCSCSKYWLCSFRFIAFTHLSVLDSLFYWPSYININGTIKLHVVYYALTCSWWGKFIIMLLQCYT